MNRAFYTTALLRPPQKRWLVPHNHPGAQCHWNWMKWKWARTLEWPPDDLWNCFVNSWCVGERKKKWSAALEAIFLTAHVFSWFQLLKVGSSLWRVYMKKPQRKTSTTSSLNLEKLRICISIWTAELATSRLRLWTSVHSFLYQHNFIYYDLFFLLKR